MRRMSLPPRFFCPFLILLCVHSYSRFFFLGKYIMYACVWRRFHVHMYVFISFLRTFTFKTNNQSIKAFLLLVLSSLLLTPITVPYLSLHMFPCFFFFSFFLFCYRACHVPFFDFLVRDSLLIFFSARQRVRSFSNFVHTEVTISVLWLQGKEKKKEIKINK